MERAATSGLQTKEKALTAMPIGAMRASIEARPALLFFIDRQRMGRDCISERLASLLPEWHVEPCPRQGSCIGM